MRIPDTFPFYKVFTEFLNTYTRCTTYWYIPKVRTINDDNLFAVRQIVLLVFNEFLETTWNQATQFNLLERLSELEVLQPYQPDGTQVDRTALIRMWKKLLETLGLLYIEDNKQIMITDAGLDFISEDDSSREIIEKQIARYQYPNPTVSSPYANKFDGLIAPLFLLEVLKQCDFELTFLEYELFVNLAQSHDDTTKIVKYINCWRELTQDEQQQLLNIVETIPMREYSANRMLPFNYENDDSLSRRYERIKKDGSYQRAFFCYPNYLGIVNNTIVCTTSDVLNRMLQEKKDNFKVSTFNSIEDWFVYFGDPTRQPSWLTYFIEQLERASTETELQEIQELVGKNKDKLSDEDVTEITRRQVEKSIETYYVNHLDMLEQGLKLVEDGRQYSTPIGRIDLLCKSDSDEYVIIEVKAEEAKDSVFGQILRYIGWIHGNMPDGNHNVRGIILASQFSDKARYSRIGLLKDNANQFIQFRKHHLDISNL